MTLPVAEAARRATITVQKSLLRELADQRGELRARLRAAKEEKMRKRVIDAIVRDLTNVYAKEYRARRTLNKALAAGK